MQHFVIAFEVVQSVLKIGSTAVPYQVTLHVMSPHLHPRYKVSLEDPVHVHHNLCTMSTCHLVFSSDGFKCYRFLVMFI